MAMILFFIGDLLTLQVQLLMLNILLIACLLCFLKLDIDIRFTDRFKKIENEEISNENFEEPVTIEVEFDSESKGGLKTFQNVFLNQFTAVVIICYSNWQVSKPLRFFSINYRVFFTAKERKIFH